MVRLQHRQHDRCLLRTISSGQRKHELRCSASYYYTNEHARDGIRGCFSDCSVHRHRHCHRLRRTRNHELLCSALDYQQSGLVWHLSAGLHRLHDHRTDSRRAAL